MNIGLRQGSSQPTHVYQGDRVGKQEGKCEGILGRMLSADNLTVVAESKWEMQELLGEWKEVFRKHELMSMEKNEVMWVGQQRKEMNIRLEGKEIRQGNRFECLGGQ